MYNDRNLQHPVITQIERNGYPDEYLEEQDECAWCGTRFRVGDNTFTRCGEDICEPCFRQWLKEQLEEMPITDIADALEIPHDVYG